LLLCWRQALARLCSPVCRAPRKRRPTCRSRGSIAARPGATSVNQRFSDTFSYGDLTIQFVFSCYLIKHDDQHLLWDAGHAMTMPNVAPKVSLIDQLGQITFVGISHYHADHTGQVGSFPKATLLIGKGDWDAITSPKPAEGVKFAPFEN